MGIEELIKKYLTTKKNYKRLNFDDVQTEDREWYLSELYQKSLTDIINDLKQLKSSLPTQQDKVVVPVVKQFIADWYEENKGDLTQGMFDLTRRVLEAGSRNKRTEMQNLLYDGDVDLIELFHRMKDGYTVEKEQLYYVSLPFVGFLTDSYDNPTTRCKKDAARSTEKEIKSLSLDYWAFAVPVEEEVE